MGVFWSGRQGLQRKSNSDALTLGRNGQLLVCLLVDAAERTPASREFARAWGRRVVPQVLAGWNGDDGTILALLQQEQRTLRHEFLLEVASYCLLYLAHLARWDEFLVYGYESTGEETFFHNLRGPKPRSRRLFAFHRRDLAGLAAPAVHPFGYLRAASGDEVWS